jgi:hypothetical protein
MVRWRNLATGAETEAEPNSLHYPWILADPTERAKAAARAHIGERLEAARAANPEAPKAKRGRKPKAAAEGPGDA